jgi:hypothetical protein
MRELGHRVRDRALVAEAQAECDGMARRARQYIDAIVGRLTAPRYQFRILIKGVKVIDSGAGLPVEKRGLQAERTRR